MKFSIKDFFSKDDQIRRKLQIWSPLLKKSLMENFIFCVVRFMKQCQGVKQSWTEEENLDICFFKIFDY